jgi:hypothetical protein
MTTTPTAPPLTTERLIEMRDAIAKEVSPLRKHIRWEMLTSSMKDQAREYADRILQPLLDALTAERAASRAAEERGRRQGVSDAIDAVSEMRRQAALAVSGPKPGDRRGAIAMHAALDALVGLLAKMLTAPSHPTLEGHPAYEAFKRAPFDAESVSDEERAAVEEARAGAFTRDVPAGGTAKAGEEGCNG